MRAIAGAALVATLLLTGCSPAVSPSAAPATTTAPSAGKPSPSASASGSGTATPSAPSASVGAHPGRGLAGRHRCRPRVPGASPPRSVARHAPCRLGRRSGRGQGPDPGHDRRRGPGRGRAPGLDAGLGRPRRPHRDLPVHAGERHPRVPDPDVAVQRRPRDHRGARAVRGPRRLADRGGRWPPHRGRHGRSSSRSRRATTRRTCSRTLRCICARASCSPVSA